jgi:hypothetical protein
MKFLLYLQLFVNNSQYVAYSVDWSVVLGFLKFVIISTDFMSSIHRTNKTFCIWFILFDLTRGVWYGFQMGTYLARNDPFLQV